MYAVLNGPRSKASHAGFVLDGNGQILMPRYFPICLGCFVKENAPHSKGL